jgi:hypothetical protein
MADLTKIKNEVNSINEKLLSVNSSVMNMEEQI